ncbi:SdpI family protein [Halosquirtibacter laminarini]|uniref:SdpI family protein n=1 Tax=Halosquirtibacter laminarini TaxID=3374600 RepID=A0AC61NNB7_9BACT|nr:SdpI family protein [Prolixibacteraceae bacterium]
MNLKKEIPNWIIISLPFIYLAFVWSELPQTIPIHWNIDGEIDRYGSKISLFFISLLLPLSTYLILHFLPKIDPKKKMKKMGRKLASLKLLLTSVMSIIAIFIIYAAKHKTIGDPNYFLLLNGLLFTIIGNSMKTIPPNYFLGIKVPWTLESETVWKATHKLGGVIWFVGGLIVILSSLILPIKTSNTLFIIIISIMVIVPIAYSGILFRKLKRENTI